MNHPFPHRFRVIAPMRSPRYFHTRYLAWDYARHINGATTHVRRIYDNGATGPWEELEVKS